MLLGLLAAFFRHPYFGLTALPGLVLALVNRRKLSKHATLTQEISSREKEVIRKFNSKFGSVLEGEVKRKNQLETVIDLVPDRVEEQLKQEENIKEIKSRKNELEEEINRLKLRSEELPEKLKELKKEKKELSDRIHRAKQGVKEARNTLAELRDRTNVPDLTSLKEKREAKKKIEKKLRESAAQLRPYLQGPLSTRQWHRYYAAIIGVGALALGGSWLLALSAGSVQLVLLGVLVAVAFCTTVHAWNVSSQ